MKQKQQQKRVSKQVSDFEASEVSMKVSVCDQNRPIVKSPQHERLIRIRKRNLAAIAKARKFYKSKNASKSTA